MNDVAVSPASSKIVYAATQPGPHTPGTLFAVLGSFGLARSRDRGLHWTALPVPPATGITDVEVDPANLSIVYARRGRPAPPEHRRRRLLQGGRFRVEAAWADFQGNTGTGQPIPMTNETGVLWFFDPGNVELVVKILDGRGVNGKFWVFAASLTSVELP